MKNMTIGNKILMLLDSIIGSNLSRRGYIITIGFIAISTITSIMVLENYFITGVSQSIATNSGEFSSIWKFLIQVMISITSMLIAIFVIGWTKNLDSSSRFENNTSKTDPSLSTQ